MLVTTLLCVVCCGLSSTALASADWLPISNDDLQMQNEPKAPGAPAIVLYRQVDRNDAEFREDNYLRIKILTEEGRSAADVHLAFVRNRMAIRDVAARVIHPDGRIVNFDGNTYEKELAESKDIDAREKTFTLPDVQVGCIIEQQYAPQLPELPGLQFALDT